MISYSLPGFTTWQWKITHLYLIFPALSLSLSLSPSPSLYRHVEGSAINRLTYIPLACGFPGCSPYLMTLEGRCITLIILSAKKQDHSHLKVPFHRIVIRSIRDSMGFSTFINMIIPSKCYMLLYVGLYARIIFSGGPNIKALSLGLIHDIPMISHGWHVSKTGPGTTDRLVSNIQGRYIQIKYHKITIIQLVNQPEIG